LSHNEGSTFAYDGRIVTIGGRALSAGRENQDDVLAFDPASGRWSHLGHIPRRLLGAVAFAHGDAAFAGFGAINNNNPANPRLWRSELRNAWRLAEALPLDLGEVAAGVIGNSMYVLGEGSPRMMRYDLAAATTELLESVRPAFGHHHAAEVIDGRLWLLGGLGTAAGLVQIFDPATRQWTFAPPMPFAAGSSASAVIGGTIYVAGGIVDRRTTGAAAAFDPVAGTWRTIAPMPRPRNHTASATDGERLYVFGGRGPGSGDDNVVATGFDDVQIYDPASDTWRVSDGTAGAPQPLPQARGGMGKAVWLGGEFWVLGGETEDGPGATWRGVYDRVDVYNPRTNQWRSGPPMRTPRHGIFPVRHDGQIIVAGGGVRAGASRTHIVEAIWPGTGHP
jgi:N-acetylneuraminic acid mutarotase